MFFTQQSLYKTVQRIFVKTPKSQSTFLNNDNTFVDNNNTYDNDKTYITHTITHMIQNIRFKTKKNTESKKEEKLVFQKEQVENKYLLKPAF